MTLKAIGKALSLSWESSEACFETWHADGRSRLKVAMQTFLQSGSVSLEVFVFHPTLTERNSQFDAYEHSITLCHFSSFKLIMLLSSGSSTLAIVSRQLQLPLRSTPK